MFGAKKCKFFNQPPANFVPFLRILYVFQQADIVVAVPKLRIGTAKSRSNVVNVLAGA